MKYLTLLLVFDITSLSDERLPPTCAKTGAAESQLTAYIYAIDPDSSPEFSCFFAFEELK